MNYNNLLNICRDQLSPCLLLRDWYFVDFRQSETRPTHRGRPLKIARRTAVFEVVLPESRGVIPNDVDRKLHDTITGYRKCIA